MASDAGNGMSKSRMTPVNEKQKLQKKEQKQAKTWRISD